MGFTPVADWNRHVRFPFGFDNHWVVCGLQIKMLPKNLLPIPLVARRLHPGFRGTSFLSRFRRAAREKLDNAEVVLRNFFIVGDRIRGFTRLVPLPFKEVLLWAV